MEKEYVLDFLKRVAEGIAQVFGPACETLIHDMRDPSHPILAIYNGHVTGREVGSEEDIFGFVGKHDQAVFSDRDYVNHLVITGKNRSIKSSTFNFVGDDFHYALGINFDFTSLQGAIKELGEIANVDVELESAIDSVAETQLDELFNACMSHMGKPISKMKKSDRLRLVAMLYERNAFNFQKSVVFVSEKLGVSRTTIYKYIKEIESNPLL